MHLIHTHERSIGSHLGKLGRGLGVLSCSRRNTHDKLRFHRILLRIIRGVVNHFSLALASHQGYQSECT